MGSGECGRRADVQRPELWKLLQPGLEVHHVLDEHTKSGTSGNGSRTVRLYDFKGSGTPCAQIISHGFRCLFSRVCVLAVLDLNFRSSWFG